MKVAIAQRSWLVLFVIGCRGGGPSGAGSEAGLADPGSPPAEDGLPSDVGNPPAEDGAPPQAFADLTATIRGRQAGLSA